jgi:LuxR family transcriptional regulator, maltose regulon positive regulatory protein
MLVRERLLDRLRDRWIASVTVVSAPAGYGKTTLLAQAISENATGPLGIDCWLACTPDVAAAASSLGSALCRSIGIAPVGHADEAEVANTIVEALWQRSPQQVALIIDDVHEVPPGSDAGALLAEIVAALPANGHIVLAGRQPPPLPLARLEVEGRVVRIDETDLTFTDAELTEFAVLRDVARSNLSGCAGWPAMAELHASARADAAGDYIGQEILASWSANRRRDLALLAHLGPFDNDLAVAVVGPGTVVGDLIAGLPLVDRLAEGQWLLHSLWQSLLASDVTPEEVAEARRRAGRAQLARGRIDTAIRLLIDSGSWDDVDRAIVEALGAAHPPVARDVLDEWYRRLPGGNRDRPSSRLLAAVLRGEGEIEAAWAEFEGCATAFRAVGETTGELASLVQLGQIAWWSDRPDRLGSVAARAFELDAMGCEEAVPFACLGRAMLLDIVGDNRGTLSELERIPAGSMSEPWLGLVSWAEAIAHLQLGHLAAAQEAAETALTYSGSLHSPLADGTRLQARWYQGHLAEVLDALPAHLQQVAESGYRNNTTLVAAGCSVAHAFHGQPDQAARYLEQARTAANLVPDTPLIHTHLVLAEALLAIASGDEPRASEVLAAYVDRHPVGIGLADATQRRHVALLYVLVPATRQAWDAFDLGPAWLVGRDLARAVVAVREHGTFPSATPGLNAAVVRAHLPPPWVAELGVAAIAAHRDDGWRLLDESWPVTRGAVADLAVRGRGRTRQVAREVLGQLPAPPIARLELRLLGPVELRADDLLVRHPAWRRERVRALLAYLALHGTVSRARLAEVLWPTHDPAARAANLRVTLTYLLRVLEPQRAPRDASFFIRQHGANLSLHPENWLTVDLWDFDRLCDEAAEADRRGAPATTLDRALQAVELWRGEPTELLSEEWILVPFERRQRRFTSVATRAGELVLAQGAFDRAHTLAEQALAIDPWLETAHRLVVAAHRSAGNDLAARAALQRYREAMNELGVGPGEATLMIERLLDRPSIIPNQR